MSDGDSLLKEVQAVKTLLMMQALAMGYNQKQLAAALGVSEASVSRMLPTGLSKQAAKARPRRERE